MLSERPEEIYTKGGGNNSAGIHNGITTLWNPQRALEPKRNPTTRTSSPSPSRTFEFSEPKVVMEWLQSWPSWFPFGETKQGYANIFPEWKGMVSIPLPALSLHHLCRNNTLIYQEPLTTSLAKLFFSFCFILVVALATSFVMTIVGDRHGLPAFFLSIPSSIFKLTYLLYIYRVPDQSSYPPLPDIFLDSIPLIPIAFALAELIILCEGRFTSPHVGKVNSTFKQA